MEIPRARLAAFAALTGVAALVVTVLLSEVLARRLEGERFVGGLSPMGRPVQAIAEHDPDLGWINRPNIVTRVDAPTFSYTVRHNARGERGPDLPHAKPAGVKRVVVLGDSLAWGWGVDDGKEFVALAQRELGPEVELVNLAVPGYSTDQQLARLERDGWAYQPDLVLLCFVLNDVEGNREASGPMGRRKPLRVLRDDGAWELAGHPVSAPTEAPEAPASLATRLHARSALAQAWARRRAPQGAEKGRAAEGAPAAPRLIGELGPNDRASLAEQARVAAAMADELVDPRSPTRFALDALNDACRARGVPLLAFSICHHHDQHVYSAGFPRRAGLELHFEPGAPPYESLLARRLREAGDELGFEVFGVDHAMLAATLAGHDLDAGDGHLGELGNVIVSQRLVDELALRLGLDPRGP